MKTKMTTIGKIAIVCMALCMSVSTFAQTTTKKESLAIFNLDAKGVNLDPEQLGNLARIEIGKLDLFEVMDKYDVQYTIDQNKIIVDNCYGKLCIVEVGNKINVDKIMTGSVELYGETIVITLRLIDIKDNITEKTQIKEFLNLQNDIQSMIQLTLNEMFKLPVNTLLEQRLTNKFNYDNSVNNPNESSLNLSGPRMGYTFYTGETAVILKAAKSQGGFDCYSPAMFQFGYQFETQYLNEGNFQALFEFIPMVTGLDQGMILPSLSVLNGIRNNLNGYEIAFGPSFFASRTAKGFYVGNNWYREGMYTGTEAHNEAEERLDSNGKLKLNSSFIVAVGKTFISGKLNIPVNAYISPSKDGFRFGISMGYNAKK